MQQVKATNATKGMSIGQSILVEDDDNLRHLPNQNSTSRMQWTFSTWFKLNKPDTDKNRSLLGGNKVPVYENWDHDRSNFAMDSNTEGMRMFYTQRTNNAFVGDMSFKVRLVDESAWYHIHAVYDSPNADQDERFRLYLNGIRCEVESYGTVISQNQESWMMYNGGIQNVVSDWNSGGRTATGYYSETHFIDGQTLGPEHFASESGGIYNPIKYEGTYGINGFYLPFRSPNLGEDHSGNGNNFIVYGINATSIVSDSPTNNYCTLNPLDPTGSTFSNGNLTTTGDATTTFDGIDGKWYYEKDGVGVTVDGAVGTVGSGAYNFGQRAFSGGIPLGYKVLYSQSLTNVKDESDTSYVGNGLDDGPFISMGGPVDSYKLNGVSMFSPDYNPLDSTKDWLSNGFKCRSMLDNTNGVTYNITDVVLKMPFKYSRGR